MLERAIVLLTFSLLSGVTAGTCGYSLGRGTAKPYPAPSLCASAAASAPASSADEAVLGSPMPIASASADTPAPAPPAAPGVRPDDLVRSAVGRWKAADGTIVEVDPPLPSPGKAPPFKLVARGTHLPRSGFGCEFATATRDGGGGKIVRVAPGPGNLTYFPAWCERGKRATVGLGVVDQVLTLVVLQDGGVRLNVTGPRVPASP